MLIKYDNLKLIQQKEMLERLVAGDSPVVKNVRKIISTELATMRKEMTKEAKDAMDSDPRHARTAVRRSVYKAILGGQVNILNPRTAGQKRLIRMRRKMDSNPHQWGGNRTKVSQRTENLNSYCGKDRGFILRFLNNGTGARTSSYGNRGSISARMWFNNASKGEMEKAAERISRLIDEEIDKQMK